MNSLNLVFLLALIAFLFYKRGRINAGRIFAIAAVFLFVLASTPFVPEFFVRRLESRYKAFDPKEFKCRGQVLVHVLGGGCSNEQDFPPNMRLELPTLGRLVEGLRIVNHVDSSYLVTSGGSRQNAQSQAAVAKSAAIAMGLSAFRIRTLDMPQTTEEEANALSEKFGNHVTLILVTDAIHMPRAVRIFKSAGFHPFPAPTNYVFKGKRDTWLGWLPSQRNLALSDLLLHEFFGQIKADLF